MKQGRFYVASALALSLYSLSGCAAEETPSGNEGGQVPEDWYDENKYPEIGGAFHTLTALATTPTFTTGTLTVTSSTNEVIVVGKRAIDSAIMVNGVATAATTTTLKKLLITGTGTSNQTVIIDFLGGVFGAGTTSARGLDVNLGDGTDSLRIRGSTAGDTFAVGTDGFSFNVDNYRDADVAWATVETVAFALAAGNDSFIATAGAKGVAGNAAKNLTVYGGDGNDTITGGDGNDALFGGNGNDTLSGGAVNSGYNTLSGEAGADTIAQGADPNGADRVHCGTEAVVVPESPVVDTVTYALRGTAAVRAIAGADAAAALAAAIASDGESVAVTVGGTSCLGQVKSGNANGCAACTDVMTGNDPLTDTAGADLNCDATDAFDLTEYPANDGDETESGGSLVSGLLSGSTKAVSENDAIAPDCEVVVGSMDDDALTGDSAANTLTGGSGDDVFVGNGGADTLNGDAGDDTFNETNTTVGAGADVFNGGAGTDTVTYASRSNALTVTMDGAEDDDGESSEGDNVKADVENLIAGSAGDTITGNNLGNALTGGDGNDSLTGGGGDDVFEEGVASNGADVFNGGSGTDTVNYRSRTTAVTVTMDGAAADDGAGSEADDVKEDIENCNGGDGVDSITGNDLGNILNGGAGNDTLLSGLGGDDFLDAEGGGAVTNNGGEGDDICVGGTTHTLCEL